MRIYCVIFFHCFAFPAPVAAFAFFTEGPSTLQACYADAVTTLCDATHMAFSETFSDETAFITFRPLWFFF